MRLSFPTPTIGMKSIEARLFLDKTVSKNRGVKKNRSPSHKATGGIVSVALFDIAQRPSASSTSVLQYTKPVEIVSQYLMYISTGVFYVIDYCRGSYFILL